MKLLILTGLLLVLLAGSAQAQRRLLLTWQDNASDETSYTVQRRISPAGFTSGTACSSGAVTSCEVTGLAANTQEYADTQVTLGTTYCYQVLAINATGPSSPTAEACMRHRPKRGPTEEVPR